MWRNFLFLLLSLFSIPQLSANELQAYTDIRSTSFSKPIAIDGMLDHWDANFEGGDTALTYNRAEIGIRWRSWQLGLIEKLDYLLDFNPQTAELVYLTENHLPLTPGKEYALRIDASHIHSRGLRLAYQNNIRPNLKIGLGASYLKGKRLTDGSIHGLAQVTAENDYNFQFETDYFYSRDVLFEREVDSPNGHGYSLDFKLSWTPRWIKQQRLSTQLEIIDLIGKMYWKGAPHTSATASSDTKSYDDDGYVRYKPAISGKESNQDFVQDLPRKIFLEADYQWSDRLNLIAQLYDYRIQRFTHVGAAWTLQQHSKFKTLFNLQAKALILGYQYQWFLIELGSDSLAFDEAKYLSLALSVNSGF